MVGTILTYSIDAICDMIVQVSLLMTVLWKFIFDKTDMIARLFDVELTVIFVLINMMDIVYLKIIRDHNDRQDGSRRGGVA